MPTAAKPKHSSLAAALFAVQAELTKVLKDGKNPHFNSTFATLPGIVEAVNPVLQKHGLAYSQPLDRVAAKPALKTVLMHPESEQMIEGICPFPEGLNAQQTGSAVTYYRRYSLLGILGIVADEDDDGQAAIPPAQATQAAAVAESQATQAPLPALPAAPQTAGVGGGVVL
jgi:hypothetical protein